MNPVTCLVTVLSIIQLVYCSNHLNNKDKNQVNFIQQQQQRQQQQQQPVSLAKSDEKSTVQSEYVAVESTGVHFFALPSDQLNKGHNQQIEAAESHHHSKHYKHHKHHEKGKHEGK